MDLVNATREARALPYAPVKDALLAPVVASDGTLDARVFEGTSVKRGGAFLVFQDGAQQQAVPIAAISAAIYHGVIPRDGITALHKKADDDAKRAEAAEKKAAEKAAQS